MRNIFIWIVIVFGVLGSVKYPLAATISAASCSRVDVQNAIDAGSDGDEVLIPAGDCTGANAWTSGITVSKGITIQGAGDFYSVGDYCNGSSDFHSGTSETKIEAKGGVVTHLISMNVAFLKKWKISGLTISGGVGHDANNGLILISGTATGWRVTGNKFTNFYAYSVPIITTFTGTGYGLIDNNLIVAYDHYYAGEITINGTNSSNDNGTAQWDIPYVFGSGNMTYIENNKWDGSDFIRSGVNSYGDQAPDAFMWVTDGYFGGKVVFRCNYAFNYNLSWHGSDTSTRGFIGAEIYNNTFTNNKTGPYAIGRVMSHRSGTALIYNNTVTGLWTAFSLPYNYRTKTGGLGIWSAQAGVIAMADRLNFAVRPGPRRAPLMPIVPGALAPVIVMSVAATVT